MSARRQRNREGWPAHLYETSGYFYWRHPLTRKSFGLGRDLEKAKVQAVEANLHVSQLRDKARLIDRLTGDDVQTVSALLARYVTDLGKRNLAINTIKTKRTLLKRIEERWGDLPYSRVTTLMIDEFLQEYIQAGKQRMAQSFRSFLVELGNKAIAVGWATHNPAQVTEAVNVKVKRARLTLDEFMIIHAAAARLDPYVQCSMELALLTGQRREDIALWDRSIIRDDFLWVEQGKSANTEARGLGLQTRLAIPLGLRLTAKTETGIPVDFQLKKVVAKCWADRVASKYLIHQTKNRNNSKPGDPVWKDTLSKSFSRARNMTDLDWKGKAPPSFHEIRSLSIRLWKKLQGKDFAQSIAGHKQASTTDIYADERGNWAVIKVADC